VYPLARYCTKIAKNYRKERWSAILADVLDMSLQCARKLDLTDDEIALSLEFISEGAPYGRRYAVMLKRAHAADRVVRCTSLVFAAVAAPADHRQAIQGAVLDMILVHL